MRKAPADSAKGVYNVTAMARDKANGKAPHPTTFTEDVRPFAASLPPMRCNPKSHPPCTLAGAPVAGYVRLPLMHIFVDGAIVEIFFNGEVTTILAEHATSGGIAMEIEEGAALVTMDAWKMEDSIE